MFPLYENSIRPKLSAYAYSFQRRVLTIDNCSSSYATLATRYNSGVRFQPFLSTPVRFATLYNNAETRRNARKVQLPPYLIYWIIGIKLPHLCARRPSLPLPPPKRWRNPPCNFQPPWRALDPAGAWWGDLCALIKPTSILALLTSSSASYSLVLSRPLSLYPSTLLFGSRSQCGGE